VPDEFTPYPDEYFRGAPPQIAIDRTRAGRQRRWPTLARLARQPPEQSGDRAPGRGPHEGGVRKVDLPAPVSGHRGDRAVDCAPEEIGIAPDLLGQTDLRTTKKHYIQAVGMKEHALVQEVIAARRRAATSRGTSGA